MNTQIIERNINRQNDTVDYGYYLTFGVIIAGLVLTIIWVTNRTPRAEASNNITGVELLAPRAASALLSLEVDFVPPHTYSSEYADSKHIRPETASTVAHKWQWNSCYRHYA